MSTCFKLKKIWSSSKSAFMRLNNMDLKGLTHTKFRLNLIVKVLRGILNKVVGKLKKVLLLKVWLLNITI